MKIKEIKLYGFKSFCDEMKILLTPGVTAFVGPNGSGKSNIFDALRWIFGEQSMKALRCERTEDLIYESADSNNDAKFTEVSVTVENEEYFPQFGSEFEIRRRFYRTGESEFSLNRVKCRLQDIQALFLNSGTLTYSFLELAEIEKIIHGDTKEMFDDVSGILKYRERREQTKRRLESTEQDLLRLEDIIAEMQRGLRSLKKQVRQARLYQELKEEYKNLSLYIIKNEYNITIQELASVETQIDNQELQKQSILQEIKRIENERELLKSEMANVELNKKETLSQIAAIDVTIDDLQKRIEEKDAEAKQITLSCERILASIKEKEETLSNDNNQRLDLESGLKEIIDKISHLTSNTETEHEQLNKKNERYFSLKNDFKERERIAVELSNRSQIQKNELAKLQFEKTNKESILSRITEEYEAQKQESEHKNWLNKELEKEYNLIVKQQEEASTRLEQTNKKMGDLQKILGELEIDLQKRQEAITEYKIIIDTLNRRLQEKGSNKEIEKRFDKKIKSLFRNNLEVTPGYESIIDLCLGNLMNFYLLSSFEKKDFADLPEGRFGFIDTNVREENSNLPVLDQELSLVTKFVKFKTAQNVLEKYLSNYFLVDDFDKAYMLSQKFQAHGFVTRDGILFRNGTIIIEKGEIGYFMINQSRKEYKEKLETVQNEVLFMREEKKRLDSEIAEAKNDIDEEKNRLFTINVKKSEHSLKLSEMTKSIETMHKEIDNLKEDQDNLHKEIESITTFINNQLTDAENIKNEMQKEEDEKNNLASSMNQIQEEIDEKNSVLNELTLESVVLEERKSSIEKSIEQLKERDHKIEKEIAKLKEDIGTNNLTKIEASTKTLKEQLNQKKIERAEYESRLPEKLIEDFNQRQSTIYDQLTQQQKVHEEIQNGIMQLKYQSFQLNHKKDEAIKKTRDDFSIDLPNYVSEEVVDADTRLLEAKGKLEKLGEINPLSLELYENEKKRLDEFLTQRDDIITAKRNLLKSIEELDQRAQERFIDIFKQVKGEFNFVFSNFFEDGSADLILADENNPLISSVEIVVRMAGKRLKTINQLSGGQRTLLAVSLLLAFYLVKPAPFCILDEIDAPLDDANVIRFNKFLRKLAQTTQVIIITHNRATMEYTDYLYGVTMEKPRQSKIISAKLADLEKVGSLE